ncbi:MAG TPA: hypothetical protein VHX66_06935 [Solirubrobacteraceae bacterium]|nr:hypothetical protein [Solirubrobacteraceae bacterium]
MRAVPPWAWAFLLYLCVALLTIGRAAIANPGGACACNAASADPAAYMWSLAWWPYALLHGANPFFSHVIWAPGGTNVAAAATIPAAAIALWPVTAVFGPLVSFNALAILGPPLGGLTAYLLCRRLASSNSAALMGGFLFAFSSSELTQSLGHANLALVFLIPVMVHLPLRRLAGELSGRRFITGMAVVFVVQALLSTEILFDAVLIGAGTLIIGYYVAARPLRPRIDVLARETVIAGVAAGLVLLPYLLAALASGQALRGGTYGLDALNLITPTPITWLGGSLLRHVSATFEHGFLSETGGYMSLPLLCALAALARSTWRTQRKTQMLVLTFILSVTLALGSPLHIAGHAVLPLPWDLLQRLPLVPALVPSRIAIFAQLAVALSVAIWLTQAGSHGARRWLIAGLGVAALFPNVAGAWWGGRPDDPSFFRTTQYEHYLTRGENVLIIPFGLYGDSMLWQAETNFYFTMPGGYISDAAPTSPQDDRADASLYASSVAGARMSAKLIPVIRIYLRRYHIRHIVIEPGYQRGLAPVLHRLASPSRQLGGILLYTVR